MHVVHCGNDGHLCCLARYSRPDVDENCLLSEDAVIFVMETVSVVLRFLNAAFGYKTARMTGMLKTSLIINVQEFPCSPVHLALS